MSQRQRLRNALFTTMCNMMRLFYLGGSFAILQNLIEKRKQSGRTIKTNGKKLLVIEMLPLGQAIFMSLSISFFY